MRCGLLEPVARDAAHAELRTSGESINATRRWPCSTWPYTFQIQSIALHFHSSPPVTTFCLAMHVTPLTSPARGLHLWSGSGVIQDDVVHRQRICNVNRAHVSSRMRRVGSRMRWLCGRTHWMSEVCRLSGAHYAARVSALRSPWQHLLTGGMNYQCCGVPISLCLSSKQRCQSRSRHCGCLAVSSSPRGQRLMERRYYVARCVSEE